MKMGFLKGMVIGACAGAAMGIMFDPLSKKEKRMIVKKIERAFDDITN